jgi:hypothetical protein
MMNKISIFVKENIEICSNSFFLVFLIQGKRIESTDRVW